MVVADVPIEETPAQRWRRRAIKTAVNVVFAALAYGLVVFGARLLHRRVLYQPPSGETPVAPPDGATLLATRAADGVAVHALHFPAPPPPPPPARKGKAPPPTREASSPPPTVVHFHGNAETADENVTLARVLLRHGLSVVLVEYRGYGRSRGPSPNEEGLYLDAIAVLDLLATKGIGPERVVLWGQSLGTGVAMEMARRQRGSRVVLVAPFTSTVDLAARNAPVLPASLVMADRFDSLSKAPEIALPTLVIHGDIDDVIPFDLGKRLADALPNGTFLPVTEGRHDNLYKNPTVIQAATSHARGS